MIRERGCRDGKKFYQEEDIHETKDNEIMADDSGDCSVTGYGGYYV